MEMKKLHFLRLRTKNSQEPFVDPLSDIKVIVHQLFRELPVAFGSTFKSKDKVDYLKAYFKVFTTRLEEDPAPMDEQFKAFDAAMKKLLTEKELLWYYYYITQYILASFALYERRDGAVDSKERGAIRATSALLSMRQELDPKLFKELQGALAGVGDLINMHQQDIHVDALCIEERDKTVKDIKEHVASMLEPGCSWEEASKACDSYALNSIESDEKAIAASLAYPDYPAPYFESEVEDGDDNSSAAAKAPVD